MIIKIIEGGGSGDFLGDGEEGLGINGRSYTEEEGLLTNGRSYVLVGVAMLKRRGY